MFSLLIKVYLPHFKWRQIKQATKVLIKHLLTKSGVMINKLEFPLWLIFHPAAFNYKRAIKECSPLAVNSEWLQRKIPELPMLYLQQLSDLGKQMRRTASDQFYSDQPSLLFQAMAWNLRYFITQSPNPHTLGWELLARLFQSHSNWMQLLLFHLLLVHTLACTFWGTAAGRWDEVWAIITVLASAITVPCLERVMRCPVRRKALLCRCVLSHLTESSHSQVMRFPGRIPP